MIKKKKEKENYSGKSKVFTYNNIFFCDTMAFAKSTTNLNGILSLFHAYKEN